jgi:hypothetical protein
MSALEASSKNYDAGAEWEAERLATTVFNLVHDGPSRPLKKSLAGGAGL